MTKEELQDIIKSHERWLNGGDGKRADLSRANLRYADLRNAYLIGANLRDADLRDANMSHSDLRGADLSSANLNDANLCYAGLSRANLSRANLNDANLCYANLSGAYLIGASLSDANLSSANLNDANLRNADLSGANLSRANLRCASLRNVKCDEHTAFYALQCPEEGSFIGYKKAHGYIVKLEILADAKRSSATSRKCRCSAAKVLSITTVDGSEEVKEIASDRDSDFIYRVGEIVRVDNFDEDRWNECSTGIHFFITRREAEQYRA